MSSGLRVAWAIIALAVVGFAWSVWQAGTARSMARVEGARADEFARQVRVAEQEATQARRVVTAYAVAVVRAREETDSVARASKRREERARQEAVAAGNAHRDAAGALRATLVTAGLPTAPLDTMEAASARKDEAHHEEVAAVREELAAVTWERDVVTRYAERMEEALVTSDRVAETLRWERESLRRQVALMDQAHAPSWQVKAGAGVAMAGVLALVVLTR